MIGRLSGLLAEKNPPQIVLDVNGVGYEIDGERVEGYPMNQTDLHHAGPVYKTLPGWGEDITWCRMRGDLPKAAQDFIAGRMSVGIVDRLEAIEIDE